MDHLIEIKFYIHLKSHVSLESGLTKILFIPTGTDNKKI